MVRKIRKHGKLVYVLKKPLRREVLRVQKVDFPLNIANLDRISFSVLRNDKNKLRVIQNISYEIYIEGRWEWVVRYDDHAGEGRLHRHVRISLKDNSDVESAEGIKKYKDKNNELTWVCKDIQRNYLIYRSRLLKNSGLDLY